MSQLVRIQGEILHVPSIARTRLYAGYFIGRPHLKYVLHNGHEETLRYSIKQWDLATQDFKKLETSRSACFEALKAVPLMEEPESNPLVESEKPLR